MSDGESRRRSWTTSEVRLLMEWAGRRPVPEICEELGRTEASVRSKAGELRRRGADVSLRCYESKLVWCPNCATWRTKVFGRSGTCLVCRLRERVARSERRCEEALASLPDEARAEFLSKQFKRGSAAPPRPRADAAEGASRYEAARSEAEFAVLVERWEVARLRRMANAEKMRLSRIRRKARTFDAGDEAG